MKGTGGTPHFFSPEMCGADMTGRNIYSDLTPTPTPTPTLTLSPTPKQEHLLWEGGRHVGGGHLHLHVALPQARVQRADAGTREWPCTHRST